MRRTLSVILSLGAVAPVSADSLDVEHERYSVVATSGDVEIRDYAPQTVAETTVAGERDAAIKEGFRRLAGYIFGANQPGEKIAMTAPVAQRRAGDAWTVRFTMPANYRLSSLPRPTSPAVRLAETPGRRVAAIRFSGVAGDGDLAANEAKLLEHVKRQGLKTRGAPHYAFYDPPWTLPWNRRNEVLVEIGG